MGWGSDPPGTGGSPLYKGAEGQAQLLSKSFRFSLSNRKQYRIAGVSWFSWRDLSPSERGNCVLCESFGLLNADSSTKPSYNAYVSVTGGS